jgi:hypothetical protein
MKAGLQVRSDVFFIKRMQQVIFPLQLEVAAQVQTLYLVVGSQFFGAAVFEDLSFDQQVGAVADGKRFRYIMIGNEDADVLIFSAWPQCFEYLPQRWGRCRQKARRAK